MLNLNCNIKVYETEGLRPSGKVYQFSHVKDIAIESSYKNFTDTATIKIPKAIVFNDFANTTGIEIARRVPLDINQASVNDFFKQDYYVEIYLGYDGDYKPAFRGYIKEVKGDAPVEIVCEDMMYFLKKHKIVPTAASKEEKDDKNPMPDNPSEEENTPIQYLKSRLQEIGVPFETKINVEDIGTIVIDRKHNIVQFLATLKKKYDIYSFFRLQDSGSVLYVTNNPCLYKEDEITSFLDTYKNQSLKIPLPKSIIKRVISLLGIKDILDFFKNDNTFIGEGRFRFHYNIISDNLKVKEESVKKVRVRAEQYFIDSNTPIPAEIGDVDGELIKKYVLHDNTQTLGVTDPITFEKRKKETEAKLELLAGLRLARVKQTGLTGSFTTFGEPFMRPIDRVYLENAEDPEKNGVFHVEEVHRSYGTGGYRQMITVGRLLKKEK